jgi:hypothetical protein
MYTSLSFYYLDTTLQATSTLPSAPAVQVQLQHLTDWLIDEYLQYQQWSSLLTYEKQQSKVYGSSTAVTLGSSTHALDQLYLRFMPLTGFTSQLLYYPLTLNYSRSIFTGLRVNFLKSRQVSIGVIFCPDEIDTFNLQSLVERFMSWYKFAQLHLDSTVRLLHLNEDDCLSNTFSSRLLSKWCSGSHLKFQAPHFSGPTAGEVHTHLTMIKDRIKRLKGVSQADLITELNFIINQWVRTWSLTVRWQTLSYCEDRLRRLLQRWAKRRHPNKGWSWVFQKYWRMGPSATKGVFWLTLLQASSPSSNLPTEVWVALKGQLVEFVQTLVKSSLMLDATSFNQWQFVCLESNQVLMMHTTLNLKKWRKSRSFYNFLLY